MTRTIAFAILGLAATAATARTIEETGLRQLLTIRRVYRGPVNRRRDRRQMRDILMSSLDGDEALRHHREGGARRRYRARFRRRPRL